MVPRARHPDGWNQTPIELDQWAWASTSTRAWARVFGVKLPLTPSRKARWRIRRPIGDERVRFGHQSLSNPILMNCPDQISMEFCLLNPSIILPTVRTFRVGALLKPRLGLLARLLAEKIAFQEAFKKRSNFTSIWTSIFVLLGRFSVPTWVPKSTKNRSKIDPKMHSILASIFYRFLIEFSSQLRPPEPSKSLFSLRKNNVFSKNRLSKLTSIFDPILAPTWPHFGIEHRPKSHRK